MLSAHCLALHVAALAVQALKAIHRSSRLESCTILMVNTASWKPRCRKPATFNIPECDHHIRTYVPTCTARIDPPIQRPCTVAFDNQSQLGFMIKFHLYLIWHLYSYKFQIFSWRHQYVGIEIHKGMSHEFNSVTTSCVSYDCDCNKDISIHTVVCEMIHNKGSAYKMLKLVLVEDRRKVEMVKIIRNY